MSFPVTLNGTTYTLADFSGTSYVDGFPNALEDFVTHAGAIYSTTSTTSNTIGTGSKTFTVEASKPYQVGTPLRIADTAAVTTNWIDAIVTSYSGTSLVVTAVAYAGSGTKTAWSINIGGGPIAYTGTLPVAQGGTGATSATAAASNLGVGTEDSPTFSGLAVNGASTITTGDNTAQLTLISTDADANDGPVLVLNRNSSSPADNDKVGQIQFLGEDDASNSTKFGSIVNQIKDTSNGSEDGRMSFNLISAGSDRTFFNLTHDGTQAEVVVNEDSQDIDFRVESNGNANMLFVDGGNNAVGIGTNSPSYAIDTLSSGAIVAQFKRNASGGASGGIRFGNNDKQFTLYGDNSDGLSIYDGSTERMRIDTSGNVLVGTTSFAGSFNDPAGIYLSGQYDYLQAIRSGGAAAGFSRNSSDGAILNFGKDGTTVGSINATEGALEIDGYPNASANMQFGGTSLIYPSVDDAADLGASTRRFDDIYATNGTIQTSDANEKQDIASLTSAEMLVAKRISALFKTFRWKDKVAAKGNDARTHTGIIAQDVQAAFTAESLDAGDYALFISSTWWEHDVEVPAVEAVAEVTEDVVIAAVQEELDEEGNVVVEAQEERTEQRVITEAVEAVDAYTRTDTYDTEDEAPAGATSKTRMGIRYPELLSFVAAYNEQRFAAIETRLTALEG